MAQQSGIIDNGATLQKELKQLKKKNADLATSSMSKADADALLSYINDSSIDNELKKILKDIVKAIRKGAEETTSGKENGK